MSEASIPEGPEGPKGPLGPKGPKGQGGSDAGNQRKEREERGHERIWELLPWYANGTLAATERREVEEHLGSCPRCRDEAEECRRENAAVRESDEVSPSPHPIQLARLMARIEAVEAAEAAAAKATTSPRGTPGTSAAAAAVNAAGPAAAGSAQNSVELADPANRADRAELAEIADIDNADTAEISLTAVAGAAAERDQRLPGRQARPTRGTGRPGPTRRARRMPALLAATPRAVRWAFAAQLALLAVLAGGQFSRPPAAIFHTLSSDSGGGQPTRGVPGAGQRSGSAAAAESSSRPEVRLVFAASTTERQIRELLLSVHGRLVGGPTPLGTYTVELMPAAGAPDPLEVVLAYLRAQPQVRFAEPVADSAGSDAPSGTLPGRLAHPANQAAPATPVRPRSGASSPVPLAAGSQQPAGLAEGGSGSGSSRERS